jgi:hypothetical protein
MANRNLKPGPKPRAGQTSAVWIKIRSTKDERERWQAEAARQTLSLADFVREAVELAIARCSTR